ncbi:hypothetical protein CspeluHIS016_0505260 [Cutaneotrichosporon spelunceum]|uniref:Uncharacterized protein n=1 Tax=Cutaneotrichosporon spelunceum TaxID=1672016 RepID=A0AAD3YE05_9TREE|nr:hypothetical protein CspeluHIS016_0505260 [Cutaneotrichosporon spelunceum]
MAAPANKTINDLEGKWVWNRQLSDPFGGILEIQGVNAMVRKAMGLASLTIHKHEYRGPPAPGGKKSEEPPLAPPTAAEVLHIDCKHVMTGGLKATTEVRCFDGQVREISDWIFGTMHTKNLVLQYADVLSLDAFLTGTGTRGPWLDEGELIFTQASSPTGWTVTQIWGFQMIEVAGKLERRLARNIVAKRTKDDKRADVRLVYDWGG